MQTNGLQHVGTGALQAMAVLMKKRGISKGSQQHCEEHGKYTSLIMANGTENTKCPKCQIAETHKQAIAQVAIDRDESAKKALANMIGEAGIPAAFADCKFSNYEAETQEQKSALNSVIKFSREFDGKHSGRCMALIGNMGNGKTHLACATGNYLLEKLNRSVRFISVSKLALLINEAKSFDSKIKASVVIDSFAKYDLLIVDEIGLQSGSDAESRALFDVFNTRYENLKPTIFISNLGVVDFSKAMGLRMIDRINDRGGVVLSLGWESYRK